MPLSRVNWGNYDLVVIDESHNFRNNDIYKDKETRYQKLMNQVIRAGVKTKVLMLSATPVNNRFTDLRNQLALAYEGQSENLSKQLKSKASIEEIFRKAQTVFNVWSKLLLRREPPARSCRCSTSISSSSGQRYDCALPQAHRDILRYGRHRIVPRTAQAVVFSLPTDRTCRRDVSQ
jgi:hypothetical protein